MKNRLQQLAQEALSHRGWIPSPSPDLLRDCAQAKDLNDLTAILRAVVGRNRSEILAPMLAKVFGTPTQEDL